jgi:hypothetical protein
VLPGSEKRERGFVTEENPLEAKHDGGLNALGAAVDFSQIENERTSVTSR